MVQTPGGGGKMTVQTDQTLCKVLKYLKFCFNDVSLRWNVPETFLDCLRSLNMLSEFVSIYRTSGKSDIWA